METRFSGQVPVRPENHEIEKARELKSILITYINCLFSKALKGESVIDLREFPDDDNEMDIKQGLLRPIGQQILASAVGELVAGGMKLTKS